MLKIALFRFQTPIVNEPADGIWNGWNCAVWSSMMKLVWLAHSCFIRNRMPSSFHSAAQHKTINKHGLSCGCVFACAAAIASSTLSVDEHVSTCCGAASFHYMAQSTVCISPYPSIGGGVRTLVCVLWNVKSNLPIARLRAENETAALADAPASERDRSKHWYHAHSQRIAIVPWCAQVCMLRNFTRNCAWYLCGTVRRQLCGNVILRYQFSLKMAVNASMCFGIFVASQ